MMTLDFASPTTYESDAALGCFGAAISDLPAINFQSKFEPVKLIADKLAAPPSEPRQARARLVEHLAKNAEQFGATLVCGRAGTGKTRLASDFAAARRAAANTTWYKVEAADADWKIFYSYLASGLNRDKFTSAELNDFVEQAIAAGVEEATALLSIFIVEAQQPLLVVLDDLHCVYDADWFAAFFNTFLPLFNGNANLLLVARSLPPVPLWRLRSKQKLSVVEESVLGFTIGETIGLFMNLGLCAHTAAFAHNRSYGRIGKLLQFAESLREQSADCACPKRQAAKIKEL